MPILDSSVSGFAWNPVTDPAQAWWNREVYFRGEVVRRRDLWASLALTPGASETGRRRALLSARLVPSADAVAEFGWTPDLHPTDAPGGKHPFGSSRESIKRDQLHRATHDKLASGGRVSDKALHAAHGHFIEGEKFHKSWAKDSGDDGGKPRPGMEFDHAVASSEAERYSAMKAATAKAVAEREKAKAFKVWNKATPKHDATYQKVKAGETVSRDALDAAHQHFKRGGELAGDELHGRAGKDGEHLLELPHDEHMKLTGAILEHGAKEDVLRKAIERHDEAAKASPPRKAAAVAKPPGEKGGKGSPVAGEADYESGETEAREPKEKKLKEKKLKAKPKGTDMPTHEIRKNLQEAFSHATAVDGVVGSMADFYREAVKKIPGLTRSQFHEHVKALEKAGHLELHDHDAPDRLTHYEAKHGIRDGAELKYHVTARTGDTPWAHGEHDDAADAAHRVLTVAKGHATPPTRQEIFAALVGKSHVLTGPSAVAAAREIHAALTERGRVSQDEVRRIVAQHVSEEERGKQDATRTAMSKAGTNHAAGAALAALLEEHTKRTGHGPGLGKNDLPTPEAVATRITAATNGRLAGASALRAAKGVLAHATTHGFDFMSGHDFAGVLDANARGDWKHSPHADIAHAVKSGADVHPKRLAAAQLSAAREYASADRVRHNLLTKYDYDVSKMSEADRKKYNKVMSRYAAAGSHIDALNAAMNKGRDRQKSAGSQAAFDDGADDCHWITIAGGPGTTHICINEDGHITKGPEGLTGRPASEALNDSRHEMIETAKQKAKEKREAREKVSKGEADAKSDSKKADAKSSGAKTDAGNRDVTETILGNPALKSLLKGGKFFGMFGPLAGVRANVWTKYKDGVAEKMAAALGYDKKPKVATADEMDKLRSQGAAIAYRGTSETSQHDGYRDGKLWVGSGLHGSGTYVAYVDPAEGGKFKDDAGAADHASGYGKHVAKFALAPDAKVVTEDDLEAQREKDYAKIAADFQAGKLNKGQFKSMHKIIADNGRYAMIKGYDAITVPRKGYMNILNRGATIAQDKNV